MVCPAWASFLLNNPWRRLIMRPEALLRAFVRPGQTVADIGCGPGFLTVPLAELVGAGGRVIAVDLQQGMLDRVKRLAARKGLADRIDLHRCTADKLGLDTPIDFAVCLWVLHEVPSQEALFSELLNCLRPDARVLIAEPYVHVRKSSFAKTLSLAQKAGYSVVGRPRVWSSRAALLTPCRNEVARDPDQS